MREILFRGKTKNGEWAYGDLFSVRMNDLTKCTYILPKDIDEEGFYDSVEMSRLVIPETVGQYTGLCDKNDTKIFEGDILAYETDDKTVVDGVVEYGKFNCSCCDGVYGWYVKNGDIRGLEVPNDFLEVIGNIHDNPELLEVEL